MRLLAMFMFVFVASCEYPYDPPTEGTYDAIGFTEAPWSTAQRTFTEGLDGCLAADRLAEAIEVFISKMQSDRYLVQLEYSSSNFPDIVQLEWVVHWSDNDGEILAEGVVAMTSKGPIEGRLEGVVHDTFGHIQVALRMPSSDGLCGDQYNFEW